MSKLRALAGLLIVFALIAAGCTGTKTMAGTQGSAGQAATLSDYKKYAGELSDEINYLNNHYLPPSNATVDQYKAWLDGFKEKLGLCGQMYNNTSIAADKYLKYLDKSSLEYGNVTGALNNYSKDIGALNASYGRYLDNFTKKEAALQAYRNRINDTMGSYNDLTGYAKGAKIKSLDEYSGFIDGFGQKEKAYESSVNNAIAAGEAYKQFLDPGSAEYKAVDDNDNSLANSVKQSRDAYNGYKNDYNSKVNAASAAQSTFKGYVDKVNKVSSDKQDLDSYTGSANALKKLDRSWLDGYRQRINAFDADCNAAINAGNDCKQYLDPSGSDYKSIADSEKNMQDYMAAYENDYKKLNATYNNLHPFGSYMK